MAPDGEQLPDEERITRGSPVRWAPGAMDGVTSHHMGAGAQEDVVRKLVASTLAYSRAPTAANKAALYEFVAGDRVLPLIDSFLESLVTQEGRSKERVYELARWLATHAPDREPVKLGIALVGLFRLPADRELFLTLGRHDEFTLFCAVALANSGDDEEPGLWTLARNVEGWGRIHAVEFLVRIANPAIRDWLLREGYRNTVMNEYLAAKCARTGGLRAALTADGVDRELLTSAGEIIAALIQGGPAEDIDDYEDACPVLEAYLAHMTTSAESIADLVNVGEVKRFLEQDEARWATRYASGWSSELRTRLRAVCSTILERPDWTDRVRAALNSTDGREFGCADAAAKVLGIDTWEVHWRRLREEPRESGRWYHVMAACDGARIESVIELAETRLDLAAIATGARDEVGVTREFAQHQCLDCVLQQLKRFPGHGTRLLETGLRSPVTRNRGAAVNALAAWTRARWTGELERSLEQAAACEPNATTRERMHKVLRGESLET
jgi:hypothetical protein